MATVEQYAAFLQKLFPIGAAWPDDKTATVVKLQNGLAEELARIDFRADVAIQESDPRQATELLPDWERVTGLPDGCSLSLGILQARRDAVAVRLSQLGGQSRAYFISLAQQVGFNVTITEFFPFEVGRSVSGDSLTNGDWIYAWRVNAPEDTVRIFTVGGSVAGEPLATWGNDLLECTINRVKPAHTVLQFGYGG
jgi:uncharacterized protein YmfQ (DUF2313 family)